MKEYITTAVLATVAGFGGGAALPAGSELEPPHADVYVDTSTSDDGTVGDAVEADREVCGTVQEEIDA